MLNTLKRDLKAGKHSLGTVITLSCPALAEIFAMCGYEWIWYDLEHTPMSLETLNMMLQASSAFPATPVVRVPIADEVTIKRILDLGVHAIIAPLIETLPAQAREGVKAMKYPPLGVRGVGLGETGYGEADWGGYFGEANEQTMFIAQIESAGRSTHGRNPRRRGRRRHLPRNFGPVRKTWLNWATPTIPGSKRRK